MRLAVLFLATYLAGSINFAILLLHLLGKEDPRSLFSGNAGTTNVYRQTGWPWAAVVLILDTGRALAAAALATHLLPAAAVSWIGLALILGNRFPCFHQFQGGKGVASYLGFTLYVSPITAALSAGLWVLVYGLVRIPFVASFCMVAGLAGGSLLAGPFQPAAALGILLTALLIFYNHKKNVVAFLAVRRKDAPAGEQGGGR